MSGKTLIDIIAESQTDRRGTCRTCNRENVAVNDIGVCPVCHLKTPGLGHAIDVVAERIVDKLLGRSSKGPKQ